jgi:hypothetical protein
VGPSARIAVRRPEGAWRDLLRSYWIEIDGIRVGTVRRGEQVQFPVEAGVHDVRAVIDWTGSPVVPVDVAEGGTARLRVGPAGNAFQFWQLLRGDSYLELTPE